MKSFLSLFLLTIFIQNSLSSSDMDVTIKGFVKEQPPVCDPNNAQGPLYVFYIQAAVSGFPDLSEGTEWKLQLDGQNAYASCRLYKDTGKDQGIACTVDISIFPLKSVKLPAQYSHYDQRYSWTVNGWNLIANQELLQASCYPPYLYYFTPNQDPHQIVCDSGYNKVTIFGKFGKYTTPTSLRRLSTDVELDFSPYLIVDDKLSQAKCVYSSLSQVNSSEDSMVCLIYGQSYFKFFSTTAIDTVEKARVLVEDSVAMKLTYCASSFLKFGGILLASLILL
jgi:hypothetical protein